MEQNKEQVENESEIRSEEELSEVTGGFYLKKSVHKKSEEPEPQKPWAEFPLT